MKKIVVVDNHPVFLNLIAGFLKKQGHRVRTAGLKMPHLPMLAFAFSAERSARECAEAGFDGFLPLPIHREKLLELVKRLLGETSRRTAAGAHPVTDRLVTQYSIREDSKRSARILLAEDNPTSQKLTRLMLTKAGYQVEVAENGRKVFERYTEAPHRFDLIFMDVQMPVMDGLEATCAIRRCEQKRQDALPLRPVPILALTANAMKGDREKCLYAGMDDYVAKPVRREMIFAMLRKWVLHH